MINNYLYVALFWCVLYFLTSSYVSDTIKFDIHWADIIFGLLPVAFLYVGLAFNPMPIVLVLTLLVLILLLGLAQIVLYSHGYPTIYAISKLRFPLYIALCACALWLWRIVPEPLGLPVVIFTAGIAMVIMASIKKSIGIAMMGIGTLVRAVGFYSNRIAPDLFGNLIFAIGIIVSVSEESKRRRQFD